uniref:Uncharacterized protein n=1 Tax=Chromera velia CCMP2878 TaxID=1169474 RepID=A0A0G4GQX2_9ALVE|eukprot:Cvel_22981.t1-p1 / transcript=Cvel_22981.t1 / gene=Cvel_22981 / organism=Chromera_velia_CCMP2878 / gene_product=hypothetical protein / transcript_product=hypothetical protein / location=Cvel_scaffold2317:23045-24687(+) / protein_length=229 / sequence_SO=supercontig / SO=protein_coding / is_pseudo=false
MVPTPAHPGPSKTPTAVPPPQMAPSSSTKKVTHIHVNPPTAVTVPVVHVVPAATIVTPVVQPTVVHHIHTVSTVPISKLEKTQEATKEKTKDKAAIVVNTAAPVVHTIPMPAEYQAVHSPSTIASLAAASQLAEQGHRIYDAVRLGADSPALEVPRFNDTFNAIRNGPVAPIVGASDPGLTGYLKHLYNSLLNKLGVYRGAPAGVPLVHVPAGVVVHAPVVATGVVKGE